MYRIATPDGKTIARSDGVSFAAAVGNADYADYLRWVAAGNNPTPYAASPITAGDVRSEAQRRIIAATGATDIIACLIKQHNAQMRATELTLIKAQGGEWTAEQAAEAALLQGLADKIKKIREHSNNLEPNPPNDFTDNKYWP